MFEIGFSEMLVIAVVALVVLGPERLPKAARFAGLWIRRARAQWDSVKTELERELAADEIKRNLAATGQALREGQADMQRQLREVETSAHANAAEVKSALDATAHAAAAEPTTPAPPAVEHATPPADKHPAE